MLEPRNRRKGALRAMMGGGRILSALERKHDINQPLPRKAGQPGIISENLSRKYTIEG